MNGAGGGAALLAVLAPLPVTLAIAWIDARRQIIPDAANIALALLGAACLASGRLAGLEDGIAAALTMRAGEAALAGLGLTGLRSLYGRLRHRTGLGLGDVKLVAASIIWIGLSGLPIMVLAASLSALAYALATGASGDRRIPFGPFLGFGLHVALAAGLAGFA